MKREERIKRALDFLRSELETETDPDELAEIRLLIRVLSRRKSATENKIDQIEQTIEDALNDEPSNVLDATMHYNNAMLQLQILVDELKGEIK